MIQIFSTCFKKILQRPLLAMVIISLIGVAVAHLLYPIWFITPANYIDPWIYWGTGENFIYPAYHFSDTYYFRRWTLIFPNYIFQHIFEPYLAQLLLRSLLLLGVMILAGMLAYRVSKNILSAMLVVAFLAGYEYVVRSIGISYSQGTGLLLFFLLLNLTIFNKKTEWVSFFKKGVIVGITSCLLLITYQWTIYLFPAIIIFALLGFFGARHTEKAESDIKLLSILLLGAAIGFTCMLMLDLAVGLLLGVPWKNLLSYSLDIGSRLSNSGSWAIDMEEFWKNQVFSRISFPLVAILIVLFNELIIKVYKKYEFRPVSFLLSFVILMHLLDPFTGGNSLKVTQTNIYMAVLCCVGLGIALSALLTEMWISNRNTSTFLLIILTFSFVFLMLSMRNNELVIVNNIINYQWVSLSLVLLLLLASYLRIIMMPKSSCGMLSVTAILLLPTLSAPMFMNNNGLRNEFASSVEAQNFMTTLSLEHRSATSVGGSARLWMLDLRPHHGWSTNITALYGNYSAVTAGYPPTPFSCEQVNWIINTQNSVIVVYGAGSFDSTVTTIRSLAAHCGDFKYEPSNILILDAITLTMKRA